MVTNPKFHACLMTFLLALCLAGASQLLFPVRAFAQSQLAQVQSVQVQNKQVQSVCVPENHLGDYTLYTSLSIDTERSQEFMAIPGTRSIISRWQKWNDAIQDYIWTCWVRIWRPDNYPSFYSIVDLTSDGVSLSVIDQRGQQWQTQKRWSDGPWTNWTPICTCAR